MMNFLKIYSVWLICLCGVLGSAAARAEGAMMYLPVPQDLVAFVSSETGVSLPGQLKIAVIDNGSDLLQHEAQPGIVYEAPGAEQSGQIYLPVKSVVHMQEDSYRAILVHELVHVAQEKSRRHYSCAGQREAEAYQLQNQYLLTHDLPTVMDGEALAVLRGCQSMAASN